MNFGASPDSWRFWSSVALKDVLPVVSNPAAKVSAHSKLKHLGKTPSVYRLPEREVVGLPEWTDRQSTAQDVLKWSTEPDYGICIQTRELVALDLDVVDYEVAAAVLKLINSALPGAPVRSRSNSAKCLLIFRCAGELTKRQLPVSGGMIELLARGQQFVAEGTHPSGSRYEWQGLTSIPLISIFQLDQLWSSLELAFGTGPSNFSSSQLSRSQRNSAAVDNDPTAKHLVDNGYLLSSNRDGSLNITCPFAEDHTSESAESATTYFPAHTGGYAKGHFKCLHAHCAHRADEDFLSALGLADDLLSEFAQLRLDAASSGLETLRSEPPASASLRFSFLQSAIFADRPLPCWAVDGVLAEQSELVQIVGAPGTGKSFFALDLAMHLASGSQWRGRRVKPATVAYIAAEGGAGLRKRVKGLGVDLASLPLYLLADSPSLINPADLRDLVPRLAELGPGLRYVFIDTLARAMDGGDENAATDMGAAIKHCRLLHQVLGVTVVLVHHTGRDQAKGGRGHSSLFGALDTEITITKPVSGPRVAKITKQKDGEDGEDFLFELERVVVGQSPEGEPIVTCKVKHLASDDAGATGAQAGRRPISGAIETLIFGKLGELTSLANGPVLLSSLRYVCISQMIPGERDRRGELFNQALQKLVAKNYIEIQDEKVRLT